MSSLNYFADKNKPRVNVDAPSWTSSKNKSLEAYNAIVELRNQKKQFIEKSQRMSDFRKKTGWQISGARVAKLIGAKPPSIWHNTTYSIHLRDFLTKTNEELNLLKTTQMEKFSRRKKKGLGGYKKNELLIEIKELKSQVNKMEKLNAKMQVEEACKNLSLPVRTKLGWT